MDDETTLFPIRPDALRRAKRAYRRSIIAAGLIVVAGIVILTARILPWEITIVVGAGTAFMASLAACGAIRIPAAFELAPDALVIHCFWGRRRLAYDRIEWIACSGRLGDPHGREKKSKHDLTLSTRWALCFPLAVSMDINGLSDFLIALRRRAFAARGKYVGEYRSDVEGIVMPSRSPDPQSASPVAALLAGLSVIAFCSLTISDIYEQYRYNRRIQEEGNRIAGTIIDRGSRNPDAEFPDFPEHFIEYEYELPPGVMHRRILDTTLDEWRGYHIGDDVAIVCLDDSPNDSRLVGEANSLFPLHALAVLLGLLLILPAAIWLGASLHRILLKKGWFRPRPVLDGELAAAERIMIYGENFAPAVSGNDDAEQTVRRMRDIRFRRVSRPFVALGGMVLLGWIGWVLMDIGWHDVLLRWKGAPVAGRVVSRREDGGHRILGVEFIAGGRMLTGERACPYYIYQRYLEGDAVTVFHLPGNPEVARLADEIRRNLWLRYGPMAFSASPRKLRLPYVSLRRQYGDIIPIPPSSALGTLAKSS